MSTFYPYLAGSLILWAVSTHAFVRSVRAGEPWGEHFGFVIASILFVVGGVIGLTAQ